jgi:hypothetical protein
MHKNSSQFSLNNTFVREQQQQIFLRAKKELEEVQMRLDLAETRRRLRFENL